MAEKYEIRRIYKALRAELDIVQASRLSNAAQAAFIQSELYKSSHQLMLYMPLGNETDTNMIISAAKADKKALVFPVTDEKSLEITPVLWDGESKFFAGAFSVREPSGTVADMSKTDVVLVPGIAFSPFGARIGFGKGCYDRFLTDFSGLKVGFCYDFQITDSILPDEHDITMDFLITEKRILNCKKETYHEKEH